MFETVGHALSSSQRGSEGASTIGQKVNGKLSLAELFCSVPYCTDIETIILKQILKRKDEMIFFSYGPDSAISRYKN